MSSRKLSEENDPAIALLSSPWKTPAYPRDPASIKGLFSGLPDRDIERLFKVIQVLADKAEASIDESDTKPPHELEQYPYELWFNLPYHAFPDGISKEDIKYALGMLYEYFGVLKSLTYYGDYEFAVKFNLKAVDFLLLKGLVDEKYAQAENSFHEVNFNVESSTLSVAGKGVLISGSKRLGQHLVLQTIFKDIHKEWSYDDIFADWDETIEYEKKKHGKSLRNRCYQINKKIAGVTTINDFLISTNRGVKINEKYLPKKS